MTPSSIVNSSPETENGQSAVELATRLTPPPQSKKDSLLIESTPISAKFSSQDHNSLDKGNRNTRLTRMAEEITGKIVGPMPARLFLDMYLLKGSVELNASDLNHFRTEIQKLASFTKEESMYPVFIESVQPLCPSLHLRDTHFKDMKVFDTITIRPDVCAYTDATDLILSDPARPDIMMEFKVDFGEDPFIDEQNGLEKVLLRDTFKAKEALGQITSYAAAQQSAQFRTHIFSLLVLPSYFRLLRWDRSGVVVTEKINLTDSLLPEFLHRYSHATPEQRGVDISVTKPSPVHAVAAREALNLSPSAALLQFSVSPNEGGYIVSRKTYMGSSKSPLGRSTRSYNAYSIDNKAVVFLKDAWRLASQKPEHDIYAQLHEKKVPYIATVIDGADIMDHVTHTQDLVKEALSWAIDLPERLRKHVHYRLVLKEVASSLATFSSTKQLVQLIRQAIIAHQKAYEDTGILHRDISVNNIMIYNGHALLIDWDLSKSNSEDQAPREIERTGTWQFMAARLLRKVVKPEGPHNLTDDLESFVHVLTWMAFVYTAHAFVKSDPVGLAQFLKSTYDGSYRNQDGKYFGGGPKAQHLVSGIMLDDAGFSNQNLFQLLTALTEQFAVRYVKDPSQSSFWTRKPARDIAKKNKVIDEHKAKLESIANSNWIIGVFDEFLGAGNWPENDAAVDHGLVELSETTTTHAQSANSRRRSRESTDEGSRKKMKSSTSHSASLHAVTESELH